MSTILDAVPASLDVRAASGRSTFKKINLRNKFHKDLSELLSQVDTLTWEAYQNKATLALS